MRIKEKGAILTCYGRKTLKQAKCPKRKQGFNCLNPLKRWRLEYTSEAIHFDSVLENNNQIVREAFKKDDDGRANHCIRARGLSPSLEPECDTQDQSNGQNGDSLPQINLIPGKIYIIYWAESDQFFAGILLPLDDLDDLEYVIRESVERVGLLSSIPSCYQYDSASKSFSWALDYKHNGSKRSERYFAFVFFDGVEFPSESSLAWVHIDNIQEWDDKKAQTIEHSQQAINYVKEGAKIQIRHYGSDDEIPDSEADDDPFSRLPSRSPSRNLQLGPDESDQEIILETQEEPEVSIGQEKPASQRDPSEDCLPSIESKYLLNEGLDLEQQFSQFERQVIDSPPASNQHNIIQATQKASRCMNGAQEKSQAQQSIITWRFPYGEVAQHQPSHTDIGRISSLPQDASNDLYKHGVDTDIAVTTSAWAIDITDSIAGTESSAP
ncbi:hypothetical protein Forpi1262_v017193 [Fusarium oxysporum f. sp. raphani]|uniref:Uncharacterized protein n=1 Tax=Fusarium oxysporum f. sp. raphani TaxID=96318 RepID=A0A8J5P6L4_FUSOX|nr:hypothetical protein Forpi1262_v017193 [Fusarium oxysporum f. sp. raphani]